MKMIIVNWCSNNFLLADDLKYILYNPFKTCKESECNFGEGLAQGTDKEDFVILPPNFQEEENEIEVIAFLNFR
jgi:hypothetical protein